MIGINCFVALKFGLGSFEDVVKLSSKHNVAPCLQFASHKSLLAIKLENCGYWLNERQISRNGRTMTYLAVCKIHKDIICKYDCDVGLGRGFSLVYSAGLLCVNGPNGGFSVLRDFELEDAVGLKRDQGCIRK